MTESTIQRPPSVNPEHAVALCALLGIVHVPNLLLYRELDYCWNGSQWTPAGHFSWLLDHPTVKVSDRWKGRPVEVDDMLLITWALNGCPLP